MRLYLRLLIFRASGIWDQWQLTDTCCVVRKGWRVSYRWNMGRKVSLKWSPRASGGRSLGADLVIKSYAKIQYMPPCIVFNVGLPCTLLELWPVNRVDGDRYSEAWPIYSPTTLECGTVKYSGGIRRGDTLVEGRSVVMVVVGRACASGCRDVDEASCSHGDSDTPQQKNHCIVNCSSCGVDFTRGVQGKSTSCNLPRWPTHEPVACQNQGCTAAVIRFGPFIKRATIIGFVLKTTIYLLFDRFIPSYHGFLCGRLKC